MASAFTTPPDVHVFQARVWEMVRQVPPGKVATYGQIAALIPPPDMDARSYWVFSPRWVGGALAACPAGVPWQRVINAQGRISLRAGAEQQRQLLESEGVQFDDRGRVDLNRYGWSGPQERA